MLQRLVRLRATSSDVKTFEVEGAKELEEAEEVKSLESETNSVTCLISLPESVLAGCSDGNVRVYGTDQSSTIRAVFTRHNSPIECLARLGEDLVVSADLYGRIFTWRPSTFEKIGSWKGNEKGVVVALAKLDENRLVVGSNMGELAVLSHSCGSNLKMEMRFRREHKDWINKVFVRNKLIVSCSNDQTAKVWSRSTLKCLATLPTEDTMNDVAISETCIVMACSNGRVYVHSDAKPYALHFVLKTPSSSVQSLISLNADIIAIADDLGFVSFLSFSNKFLLARIRVSKHSLHSLAVLDDCCIAAGGHEGCMLFSPPAQVRDAVTEYATSTYGLDGVRTVTMHPILNAWNSVQQHTLSLIEVCETVIKSEYTSKSLDEWCVAHCLLMLAVRTSVIPQSRDYKGNILHWHVELNRHCDKLAIGEKEIAFLVSLFREAEDAGVIAQGTSESFVYAVGIREDIDEENWYSANAIYQLFLRQAEADNRLQKVLRYQKVQQLTSVVNAVLGVVPIGGAIATNAISGGAAILNDFQVCGLVESLISVGRDLSGGFGSDLLVGLFIRRGNEVLREDHWGEWRDENRKAVEDAARNLGLTVEELRVRLLHAAEMVNDRQTCNEEENLADVAVVEGKGTANRAQGETSATEIVKAPAVVVSNALLDDRLTIRQEENDAEVAMGGGENGTGNRAEGETSATTIQDVPALVVANPETSELPVNFGAARVELTKWSNESLNKSSVENLKDEEAASCLAAFLVNYNKRHVVSYVRLKDALLNVFFTQFIDGSSFVHANGRQRENLIEACMSAIGVVTKGNASGFLGIRLKLFLDQVLES